MQNQRSNLVPVENESTTNAAATNPLVADTLRPTYAAAFQCIGSNCEDTCCNVWRIPLDKRTYEKYRSFPPERLGSIVAQHVSLVQQPTPNQNFFAQINISSSGCCPFYTAERLCAVQKEYGSELLSATCSIYPRVLNAVDGVLEGSLAVSCPEAARNVLLVPDALKVPGNLLSGAFRTDNQYPLASNGSRLVYKPYGHFHLVRELLIDLVKDRSRPMWQRLLRVGLLCERLNTVTSDKQSNEVPAMMSGFRADLEVNRPPAEEDMPGNCEVKLGVVLRLTSTRAEDRTCGKRFQDTFWDFIEGIGSQDASAPGDDLRRYLEAEKQFYEPFFEQRPYILENFLLNDIFRTLFPFGRGDSRTFVSRSIHDEFILLATRYAWITGILVGVAAKYKQAFAEEHVVKAIQSHAREVDHDSGIETSILEFIKTATLDNLRGMAIMLRN